MARYTVRRLGCFGYFLPRAIAFVVRQFHQSRSIILKSLRLVQHLPIPIQAQIRQIGNLPGRRLCRRPPSINVLHPEIEGSTSCSSEQPGQHRRTEVPEVKVPAGTGRIPARTYKICHGIYPNYPPAVGPGRAPVVPVAAAHLISLVFFLGRSTPPRIRRKIPAASQRPCLSSMQPNLPEPSNPSGCWIADSSLANFLGFWPKTAQARGAAPRNRAYQTCSRAPDRP